VKSIFILSVAAAFLAAAALAPTTASAWSAKNCRDSCRGSTTSEASYRACVAKWNCSHFHGRTVSKGKERAYTKKWVREHGKYASWTYED